MFTQLISIYLLWLCQPSLAFIRPIHEISNVESNFMFTELFIIGGGKATIHVDLLVGITTNSKTFQNPIVKLTILKVPIQVKWGFVTF